MDFVYQICAKISSESGLRDMFEWSKNPAENTCLLTTEKFTAIVRFLIFAIVQCLFLVVTSWQNSMGYLD